MLLSILVFSGMFTAYTYLADILERLAGFDGTVVGWCLMGFGAVGLIGNSLGGRAVDRHPLIASMVFCAFMIAGMVSLVPNIHSTRAGGGMGIWGVTQAALFLVSHVRLMKAAPDAPAFAASLNIAGANLGIGLGAMIGGRVIDSWAWLSGVGGCRVHSGVDPPGHGLMTPSRAPAPEPSQAVNNSRRAPSVIATMPGCLTLRSTEMA
jgi:predicted MFS family arabinose efflux permease